MKESTPREIGSARANNPDGTYCHKCGLTNDLADYSGWWYQDFQIRCSKCFDFSRYAGER